MTTTNPIVANAMFASRHDFKLAVGTKLSALVENTQKRLRNAIYELDKASEQNEKMISFLQKNTIDGGVLVWPFNSSKIDSIKDEIESLNGELNRFNI